MNLNGLRDEAFKIACDHGFHDTELSDEHCPTRFVRERLVEWGYSCKISKKQMFYIEKNCKNQAYFFVLSCGHFEEHREYCKTYPTNIDYHSACVDMFRLQLIKDKQNGK